MSKYPIPAQTVHAEQVIKNSRFLTWLAHAATPQQAHQFIQQQRETYPDARHVCWAFIAGQPGHTTHVSCSDDGEPAGTAGKPMLNVLQHGAIGEIVAVVVRYFGGIKLGTGGLVRAYSSSVAELYKTLPTQLKVEGQSFRLTFAYSLEDAVRRLLIHFNCKIESAHYDEQLHLVCYGPQDVFLAATASLNEIGRGQIEISIIN